MTSGMSEAVPVPMLSFWLRHERERRQYVELEFDVQVWPLPDELAAIVRRTHQHVMVDTATARFMHGREAALDWRMPAADGLPPRLVAVTLGRPLTPAEMHTCGGEGVGQILTDLTWDEFIEKFKTLHAAAPLLDEDETSE